jgi:phosphohistidine phosphatase
MKRLLLLRHAKAEQGGKDDHARTLTERGRRDAARMGAFLHEHGDVPDLVLCSTSARTRETWQQACEELGGAPKVEFLKPLYLAPAKTMLTIIQKADDAARTVLVIAHSPGTEETAVALARTSSDKEERARLEAMKEKFPTAALAVLDFDGAHWRDVKSESGTLTAFVRPKDLDD